MGFNFLDGAMAFGNGIIEADKKNTKENLLIRGKELEAKRNAIIEMKKSKYNSELASYEKNKTKHDALSSVSSKLNNGGFNYKDGENAGKVDTFALGDSFLMAKHGLDYYSKLKTSKLGAEGDPTAWRAYVKNIGNNTDLQGSISSIDYKTKQAIESNYLEGLDKIESKYSAALKNAKNDSSLVNLILGKKKEEIENLSLESETTNSNLKTIDKASSKTDITSTIADGDSSELIYADSKDSMFIPKSYKDDFAIKLKDAKNVDYSSKEYNNQFANSVLTLIPNAKTDDYFEVNDKDGSLTAKTSIINADVTIQSLISNSLDDVNEIDTYTITGNNKSKIDFNANKRFELAKSHVVDYGSWVAEGKVLSGGTLKNLFKETSTALVVPSNSIININNNKLKGFDVVINKDLRKDVGKVYRNFIMTKAEARMNNENIGGTLEENINYLQGQLERDNNGAETLTKEARTFIAMSLKDVKNNKGELVYPSLTEKKENTSSGETSSNDNKSTMDNNSTMNVKQKEMENATIGGVRTVMVDISGDGKKTLVPLTVKNKLILKKNNIAIPDVEVESTAGDGIGMEQVASKIETKKIKPIDVGSDNQSGYFETLESIKAILPNDMSGQEIIDKYNISFPINKFTKYSPSK